MTRVLIGADVGGSKTAVVVAVDDVEVARAEGIGGAVRPGRALASATTIADVVRRALGIAGRLRGDVLVVGASGAGRPEEREELRSALRSEEVATQVVVIGDIEIALAASFGNGPGIVVTAGTGSVAVARDAQGRIHRSGGYGWQMGDEGSGYAVGRAALGAIGRAADGRSPKTTLSKMVMESARCENLEQLVRWAAKGSPAEVASLAPTVMQAVAGGDTVAAGILDYAARELAQLAIQLLPFFGVDERKIVDVATTGGMLQEGSLLRRMLFAKIAEHPQMRMVERPIDPPAGALVLARAVEVR